MIYINVYYKTWGICSIIERKQMWRFILHTVREQLCSGTDTK